MKLHSQSAFRRYARRFTSSPGALILTYHRIGNCAVDPWSRIVTPENFSEQLEVIRSVAEPIGLLDLERDLMNRCLRPRSVAITFDDGYADNYELALPILREHDVPATAFVVSGQIGQTRGFWWDQLARVFLQSNALPVSLHLKIGPTRHQWDLRQFEPDSPSLHERSWRASEPPLNPRQWAYMKLWNLLGRVHDVERHDLLYRIWDWSRLDPNCPPGDRVVNRSTLISMREDSILTVGAHTASHPHLSRLARDRQFSEITQSKRQLEELVGQPVTTFSYPFGDYNQQTLDAVRTAGFSCACTSRPQSVRNGANSLELPRYEVRDWGGDQMERQLKDWFHC